MSRLSANIFLCMCLNVIGFNVYITYEFYGYAIVKKVLFFMKKNINDWNVPLFINAIWLIRQENKWHAKML